MRFYWLILGVLGVWRVTHLLEAEDGPWDLAARLRRQFGRGILGRLFDCFYCLSLWVAVPFAWLLGESLAERSLLWLALSGGAIIVERVTDARPTAAPPYWKEEDSDALLRKDARAGEAGDPADGERRH
jgi:uncharacterized protein DUF1360